MGEGRSRRARIISSVAATAIALACGSNYVYSAWAPQFADKLQLSTTQSNLIGLAGNLGMYTLGVPTGILIDTRGPRPFVIVGAVLLGLGYFPIKQAFDAGSGSIPTLCFFSFLTGFGGCMAFAASIKTSALNWPHHRGTATAFPLAAFGLSAFFFSLLGQLAFPGNTGGFLLLLALGTFGIPFCGFFFLRVLPPSSYHPLSDAPDSHDPVESQRLRRTSSQEAKPVRHGRLFVEPGMSESTAPETSSEARASPSHHPTSDALADVERQAIEEEEEEMDETSSLVSKSSSLPGEVLVQSSVDLDRSHRVDIRGWRLLRNVEFWQFFTIMGLLSGIGLMTINNIGHDANALWKHYDNTVDNTFLVTHQQMHVSILSVGSFGGRLLSGVGSDFIVKRLHASRVWCLVLASGIFCFAQFCAITITNPHFLGLISGCSGLAYGLLFGVYPSIIAETFGIHGLSQNWGFMTLSPVLSGNIFNLFYGIVFDSHSIVEPSGDRSCLQGVQCYRNAYLVTLGAGFVGIAVTLWAILHQQQARAREEGKGLAED
ncbi:uncharacterized protein E0L32_010073 [Thyridium curvatum]|uniref:Uncharacterized protein n=1 Tax=Thyridium curvatum TaxID=1093900 RepID=A0A507AP39_9PEZI|nr:uncharacterized protein E0L32_010073 [Thyridium curvatum]TPX08456.1 hypothetical protein E0L32_010073 [Thyridium curvatum]